MEEYNYKKNLEKLKERYLNKIKWLKIHTINKAPMYFKEN
ncbi:hypothetical protein FHX84_005205 [Clostridium beijerinckii]|nr:hypothetical protein [Clostridium beijerinckii]NYC69059.1 hypothetical protein [Clostridium beijerinckii]NYC91697.1 hypothetical protein [Clostridium beijerinckii]